MKQQRNCHRSRTRTPGSREGVLCHMCTNLGGPQTWKLIQTKNSSTQAMLILVYYFPHQLARRAMEHLRFVTRWPNNLQNKCPWKNASAWKRTGRTECGCSLKIEDSLATRSWTINDVIASLVKNLCLWAKHQILRPTNRSVKRKIKAPKTSSEILIKDGSW